MTDEPKGRPNDRETVRQNRLREALRENLKRRKSQSRGRIGQATMTDHGATEHGSGEPDETE